MGDRAGNLEQAIGEMRAAGVEVKRVSSVYDTEPVGVRNQPWFLNVVVEAETELFPVQLLRRLQEIEIRLGRRRGGGPEPRTIDIDVLLYGDFRIDRQDLTVPHPRLAERRFVLEPLHELVPGLRHPVSRLTVRELLADTPDRSTVRRLLR